MPFDVLGCTRATLMDSTSFKNVLSLRRFGPIFLVGGQTPAGRVGSYNGGGNLGKPLVERPGKTSESSSCWGSIIAIIDLKRGIPSKRES